MTRAETNELMALVRSMNTRLHALEQNYTLLVHELQRLGLRVSEAERQRASEMPQAIAVGG